MKNNLLKVISERLDILFFTALSLFLAQQVWRDSSGIPFSDQIDLFYNYFGGSDIWGLFFQQHGPHRQGLGTLIMYPTLHIFAGNFSSIAWLTFSLIAACGFFSLLLCRVLQLNKWISIGIIYFLLSYSAAELITITPNISHSTLAILLAILMFLFFQLRKINVNLIYVLTLLIMGFSLFTGFAIFLYLSALIIIVFNSLKMRGYIPNFKMQAVIFLLVNCIIVFLFFINYNIERGEGCLANVGLNLLDYILYASAVASIPIGGAYIGNASFVFGGLLLVAYLFVFIYISLNTSVDNYRVYIPVSIIILATLFFIASTALGRYCLGTSSAYASRYYPLSSLGLVGIFLFAGYFFSCNRKMINLILLVLLIMISMNSLYFLPGSILIGKEYSYVKSNFVECTKTFSVSHCNDMFKIYPPDSSRLEAFLTKLKK